MFKQIGLAAGNLGIAGLYTAGFLGKAGLNIGLRGAAAGMKTAQWMARNPALTTSAGIIGGALYTADRMSDNPYMGKKAFDPGNREMTRVYRPSSWEMRSRSRFMNSASGLCFGMNQKRHG